MYKPQAVLLMLFVSSFFCDAQTFRGQVLAGVATTQVSGDQLAGFDKAGLMVGAGISAVLSKKTDLGFSIYYIQKGSRKQSNIDKGDLEYYRLRLNYIEVPLLLEYHLSNKLGIELGLSAGTLVGSNEENQDGILEDQPPFIKYEFSACGGLVYHLTDNWALHLRGEQSIAPVRKHSSGAVYRLNRGQYNSVLLFALYYQFGKRN